jgi:hypothetical protein
LINLGEKALNQHKITFLNVDPSEVPGESERVHRAGVAGRRTPGLEIQVFLDGLSQLATRPGELGLPPGMLMMALRNSDGSVDGESLVHVRSRIDSAVRAGDVAFVAPGIGIVYFCGGLFFRGDLEFMGERLRRIALDSDSALPGVQLTNIIVAGAVSAHHETSENLIRRGLVTFGNSVATNRRDVVIDYPLSR